ncbi:tyrosine-protein phosphatase [Microbacterium esteraromaticum]|uniref:tyrosine-protein phosphatase n=1 Tax=Microbacterium esteraromaticum TaxID=57043 RepID=UPI0019D3E25E|nr:tyrosine-protein phosphatase [Microbacterium esteraromaticum]MBN7793796.1 tyrosine-protein phosphatase [Microbacterium esteraromaticum]
MQTIAIDGLFNVRATSPTEPWLVRTGAPENVTADGVRALRDLGVTTIVDLREPSEAGAHSHDIPVQQAGIYGAEPPASGRLEDIYTLMLRERGGALTAAVALIADSQGAALVHCTAGKDRTGLVVALARLAAGDSADAIVDDYVLSAEHVRPVREPAVRDLVLALPETERAEALRLHLDSPREAIMHALAIIDELGGAGAYLARHGLTDAQLTRLRHKNEDAR